MLSRISSSINFYVNEYNDRRYAKQILSQEYTWHRCINIKVASSDFVCIFDDANSLKGFVYRNIITNIRLLFIYISWRKILIFQYYFGTRNIICYILLDYARGYAGILHDHSNIVVTYTIWETRIY